MRNEIGVAAGTGLKDKSLYLCFSEMNNNSPMSSLFIGAINLSDILLPSPPSFSCCRNSKFLHTVFRTSRDDVPLWLGCGSFGSKLLFYDKSGLSKLSKDIFVFETDPSLDPEPEIKKDCFPSFVSNKEPWLMQLDDGKLYVLDGRQPKYNLHGKPIGLNLEVFDEGKWLGLPLELPDNTLLEQHRMYSLCYATEGTNIFLFMESDTVLYRFDVAHQAKGWIKHLTVDPVHSDGKALVLNCGDDGFVMFSYSSTSFEYEDSIQVYHMSKEYDGLRHMGSHQLPDKDHLPRNFFSENQNHCYSFVHLGGQQVCFVLATQIEHHHSFRRLCDDPDCNFDGSKMTIVVVLFEYAITNKSKKKEVEEVPESESICQINILGTRLIEFDINGHQKPDRTYGTSMIGVFAVPPPKTVPKNHKADDSSTLCVTSPMKASKKSRLNPAGFNLQGKDASGNIL